MFFHLQQKKVSRIITIFITTKPLDNFDLLLLFFYLLNTDTPSPLIDYNGMIYNYCIAEWYSMLSTFFGFFFLI